VRAVRWRMNVVDGDHLLVALERGLPWESRDGGLTWSRFTAGDNPVRTVPTREERILSPSSELRDATIFDADWDTTADPPRVFLATDRGVWFSDRGFVDEGLPQIPMHHLAYSPSAQLLVAGTRTRGAFGLDVPPLGRAPALAGRPSASGAIVSAPPSILMVAPNPFVQTTTVRLEAGAQSQVSLRIYDTAGRRVRTLLEQTLSAGSHAIDWNGRDELGRAVAPGTYFLRLQSNDVVASRRIVRLQ
jgi:hypothetical protein